jgi:fructokinase
VNDRLTSRRPAVTPYAVVLGEALVDLFEVEVAGERVFRPMVGGAPLNVACGIARLGAEARFVGSLGSDAFGDRIRALLTEQGVDHSGCVSVDVPTTLAVTSLHGAEPEFAFYGNPPSYGLLDPVDLDVIAGAGTLYCGSIALLEPTTLASAKAAWATPGPLRTIDPNVRPDLLDDPAPLRATVEWFASTADLVKLSEPDARLLFGLDAAAAAKHLLNLGANAVVVTLGARGALGFVDGAEFSVTPPPVDAVDATGAGDATMAALNFALLTGGLPATEEQWRDVLAFAVRAGSLACETRGGATAMPPLSRLEAPAA